ncbi:MAG TPA: DUF6266 family protein [Thermoplasmata archaeon]|jgi:hypothetical protein|nr:DUF6266 family protein [Thermoplasmata archaeon]
MKIRNIFGTKFSGAAGKSMIASSWKGRPYMRSYAVPYNPRTERQQANRAKFGAAKTLWRALTDEQRAAWERAAKGMSGWNLFVREFMRTNGAPASVPRISRRKRTTVVPGPSKVRKPK